MVVSHVHGTQLVAPGPSAAPVKANPGSFRVVGKSGVPAMHVGLMENGRVVFLDNVEKLYVATFAGCSACVFVRIRSSHESETNAFLFWRHSPCGWPLDQY